jgi:hypothetical protein
LQQGVKPTRMPSEGDRDSRWTILRPSAKGGAVEHGLNWLDARDGLFGEGESEGDGTEQFPADIHRAAGHTLQDAGFGKWSATESSKDDGLPWSEILEDSEDLDLEIFDSITLEDSSADPSKARADVLDWEKILTRSKSK